MMLVGWRRSGNYFYKPTMHKTCCPSYTIRLKAETFMPSKSQRKTMARVGSYLKKLRRNDGGEGKVRLEEEQAIGTEEEKAKDQKKHEQKQKQKQKQLEQKQQQEEDAAAVALLTVTHKPSSSSAEKFALYKKYQVAVHGDKPDSLTEKGFSRFLVTSSLVDTTSPAGEPQRYGSFHQEYRLDGELVAVGVVDVLPSGLSSVYLFYDPDRKDLALGKYSAMREIEFCREQGLTYYYLGFYIHTCDKMKYKGEYQPSELLCPTSLEWQPFAACAPVLDKHNFSPLRPDLAAVYEGAEKEELEKEKEKGDQSSGLIGGASEQENGSSSSRKIAAQFAPQWFSRLDEAARKRLVSVLVNTVPIKLGAQVVRLKDIVQSYVERLTQTLEEWIDNIGPDVARKATLLMG
jgi:arginine-tRNA-protein transferase